MRKTTLLVGAVMAALVFAMAGPASERGFSPHSAQARPPALTVTVACKATPEITRVKNNRNRRITIKTVGSIYQPRPDEPYRVNRTLRPDRVVTFESGSEANRNTLTRAYIYNNDVGSREGGQGCHEVGGTLRRPLWLSFNKDNARQLPSSAIVGGSFAAGRRLLKLRPFFSFRSPPKARVRFAARVR
jgi:hypothetical protein